MTAFGGALADPTRILGSRVGAYLVDGVITTIVVFALFFFLQVPRYETRDLASSADATTLCSTISNDGSGRSCVALGSTAYLLTQDQVDQARRLLTLYGVGFTALNWVLLPATTGASLGKRLFGLRVVTAEGQIAGVGRNLLRWVVGIVDFACCAIPGYLVARNSRGHRRLGDMAAGTFVVHRSALGHPLEIPGLITVRRHEEFGGWGPEPVRPEPELGEGGGIDAPVWDPSRNTYVRYDPASGVWFQWDEQTQSWIPAQA